MGRGYGGGARFERSRRVTGAGAAEMAWERGGGARFECTLTIAGAGDAEIAWDEATEGERGRMQKLRGRRLRRRSEVGGYAEVQWGWRCRNSMGGGYGGGARFECTLRIAGAGDAGDAEIAWVDATEGERGRRVR